MRSLLLRFLLCLGGASLLVVPATLGLWWLVMKHEHWLDPVLGKYRARNFCNRIVSLRMQIPSADSDGDGLPDWAEEWAGSDPQGVATHSQVFAQAHIFENFHVYADERTRIRTGMLLYPEWDAVWPTGFRAHVSANRAVLYPVDGHGPGTKGPMEIVATRDGYLEFDVLVSADDADHLVVTMKNARTGVSLMADFTGNDTLVDCPGRRLAVVPTTFVMRIIDGFSSTGPVKQDPTPGDEIALIGDLPVFGPSGAVRHLAWTPVPNAAAYVLEVARADQPETWIPYCITSQDTPGFHHLTGREYQAFPRYAGETLCRIVPVAKDLRPTAAE